MSDGTARIYGRERPGRETEPAWMSGIPNRFICNFYYTFFIIYAIILGLTVLSFVGILFLAKGNKMLQITSGIQMLIAVALAATAVLFNYLICSRALLKSGGGEEGFVNMDYQKCYENCYQTITEPYPEKCEVRCAYLLGIV
jgi:hypothetical protein